MKLSKEMATRLLCYFGGMLIMTLGVAVSVKSALGVSPISSVPYTITVVFGMDLGLATALFSLVAALLQIPILRKQYKAIDLLQFPVSIVFGFFMACCVRFVQVIPDPSSFAVKLALALISTVIIAVGVFLYVSARLIPLPTEGFLLAITKVTRYEFSTLKIVGDVSMVAISLVTCLIALHALGSIGLGTILAAVLVGAEIKLLTRWFKPALNKAMGF